MSEEKNKSTDHIIVILITSSTFCIFSQLKYTVKIVKMRKWRL